MYKTVRHGENCLQYTILPQTEEVLNNSGRKGKGRDYSPSIHIRREQRKSTAKFVLLVTCSLGVALALAAVPIVFVKISKFPRPFEYQELLSSQPLTPTGREITKTRKKELKISPEIVSTLFSRYEKSSSTSTTMKTPTTMSPTPAINNEVVKGLTPPWSMPALRSWKYSTTSKPIPTTNIQKNNVPGSSRPYQLLDRYMSARPWEDIIRPTVTSEPGPLGKLIMFSTRSTTTEKVFTPKIQDDVLITTKSSPQQTSEPSKTATENTKMQDLKDTLLSVDDDEEFRESLEVDEVFSIPPMKPETSGVGDARMDDDVTVTVKKPGEGSWYGARWPFVDTSSYFQWTDYSPRDNLLLPLLVGALTTMTAVLLLVIAIKRRKRSHSNTAQLGTLTSGLHEDNTNLLAGNENEDPEE